MPVSRPERSYLVGETVHLHVKVSKPGTKTPTDPNSVRLSSLNLAGESMMEGVPTLTFTRINLGDYTLVIPTVGFPLGTYDLTVTIESGPSAVVILGDRYVVQAP